MLGYAVLEVDLFRQEIIRRFVSTAVALHARKYCLLLSYTAPFTNF